VRQSQPPHGIKHMTRIDELQTPKQQIEESTKPPHIASLNIAHGQQQVTDAAEAVNVGASRLQDRLKKVWAALLPVQREDMPNDKLWADLLAIKNRMVFYNPAGLRPNKMKASLSLMHDDHANTLKEMICRLDADVRASA
jgi:hypothetical protein